MQAGNDTSGFPAAAAAAAAADATVVIIGLDVTQECEGGKRLSFKALRGTRFMEFGAERRMCDGVESCVRTVSKGEH